MPVIVATCHTNGCGNAGAPIEIAYDTEPPPAEQFGPPGAVFCGGCGQQISDITEPAEPEPEPEPK